MAKTFDEWFHENHKGYAAGWLDQLRSGHDEMEFGRTYRLPSPWDGSVVKLNDNILYLQDIHEGDGINEWDFALIIPLKNIPFSPDYQFGDTITVDGKEMKIWIVEWVEERVRYMVDDADSRRTGWDRNDEADVKTWTWVWEEDLAPGEDKTGLCPEGESDGYDHC